MPASISPARSAPVRQTPASMLLLPRRGLRVPPMRAYPRLRVVGGASPPEQCERPLPPCGIHVAGFYQRFYHPLRRCFRRQSKSYRLAGLTLLRPPGDSSKIP